MRLCVSAKCAYADRELWSVCIKQLRKCVDVLLLHWNFGPNLFVRVRHKRIIVRLYQPLHVSLQWRDIHYAEVIVIYLTRVRCNHSSLTRSTSIIKNDKKNSVISRTFHIESFVDFQFSISSDFRRECKSVDVVCVCVWETLTAKRPQTQSSESSDTCRT